MQCTLNSINISLQLFIFRAAYLSNIVEHGYGGTKRQWSSNDESHNQKKHSKCHVNREMVAVDTEVAINLGIFLNQKS